MKDYLLFNSYFTLGTLSTEIVHIIKYLLTQVPCYIFDLCYVIFYSWTNNEFHIVLHYLIFIFWHVLHPCTKKDLWNVNKFYSILFYQKFLQMSNTYELAIAEILLQSRSELRHNLSLLAYIILYHGSRFEYYMEEHCMSSFLHSACLSC